MNKTQENVMVFVLMVAITIGLLAFVGYDNIKDWLSTPFIWKTSDDVAIEVLSVNEKSDDKLSVELFMYNRTNQSIREYEFWVYINGVKVEIPSFNGPKLIPSISDSYEIKITNKDRGSYGEISVDNSTFQKLKRSDPEDIKIESKVRYIEFNDGTTVKNKGTFKVILIMVLSLILGLLGLVDDFPVWLRIILKVFLLPAIILLVLILLVLIIGGSKKPEDEEEEKKKKKK